MNENNDHNNVMPYKATGNLNTAIGNPSVNINDTMNINIQSLATNKPNINNSQNNNIQVQTNNTQMPVNNAQINNNTINNVVNANNINTSQNNTNNSFVKKTYVSTMDNKHKKKNISLNIGPEFKIALLIMVILLVFVFLLPMISDFIGGY